MNHQQGFSRYVLVLCMLLILHSGWSSSVWACSLVEPPADAADSLWVHLEGLCFSGDQREWSVNGADILEALKNGKSLDLQGVLVVDDVLLDQVPLQLIADIPNLPAHLRTRFQEQRVEAVRIIVGDITIRDSQFDHVFATNSRHDFLVMLGEVQITGTTFSESIDFSKIIFAQSLVFSDVNVEHEGFFIGAQFEEAVDFSYTNFGTHSRFHKAVFRGPVTFAEVAFAGVAEFLEVGFQQDTSFSATIFGSGTGFSGSIFQGNVNFSEMAAKREVYFRFSEFRENVTFHQAQFHNVADFSNSRFLGAHDFSEATFAVPPEFTESNISIDVPISSPGLNQEAIWSIVAAVGIFLGFSLWISKRNSRGISA